MPPRSDWSRSDYRLSPRQKTEAREALALLAGSGISLVQAARHALSGQRIVKSTTTAVAVEAFQLSRVRKVTRRGQPLRSATIDWYADFLAPFVRAFGDERLDTISRDRFSTWLHALPVGVTSRHATARACRALWRWAMIQNPPLVTDDATLGQSFTPPLRSDAERLVLTVEQTAAILAAAGRHRSAFALMLFAGVRPEEIAGDDKPRLRWEHIDVSEKWIRIPAEIAKTAKTRLIENLPDTLWPWLTPVTVAPGRVSAPVSAVKHGTLREFAKTAAGITRWPFDAFRHTAASYLLAYARDAGRVAEWIGHEGRPTLLHQTYRGQLTLDRTQVNHAMAIRYLALRPPA
jgi:integrase